MRHAPGGGISERLTTRDWAGHGGPVKVCVVIPTYQNGSTVGDVARRARAHLPVIVVDDGSTDGTPEALAGMDAITLLRHPANRGKGAALETGFRAAREAGYSHAISLDADGQHPVDAIPLLLARSGDCLVLGVRDLVRAGAGWGSRIGLANSNFWAWVETGRRLHDTQSGLRSYPLEAVDEVRLTTGGYAYEYEALVKLCWLGVRTEFVEVETSYPEDRVSHYRPLVDFLRIAHLNVRLVLLRLSLPAPYLGLLVRRTFHARSLRDRIRASLVELFLREPGPSGRVALSVGLGLFIGLAPIWGFQIATTLLLAHVTGLSKPIAVVASHVSVPVLVPTILYLSLVLGRFVLGVEGRPIGSLQLEGADFRAWLVGSLLLATGVSLLGTVLTWVTLRCVRG